MESEMRVVILTPDNTFVHVYPDAALMLKANDIGYGPGAHPFPLELFNDSGQRLLGAYDDAWRVTRLVPSGPPDEAGLRDRLNAALNNLRASYRNSAERLSGWGMEPRDVIEELDEAIAEATSLQDLVDLFEVDHELMALAGETDGHNNGIWHNWWKH